jgi:hypothetical protein
MEIGCAAVEEEAAELCEIPLQPVHKKEQATRNAARASLGLRLRSPFLNIKTAFSRNISFSRKNVDFGGPRVKSISKL